MFNDGKDKDMVEDTLFKIEQEIKRGKDQNRNEIAKKIKIAREMAEQSNHINNKVMQQRDFLDQDRINSFVIRKSQR